MRAVSDPVPKPATSPRDGEDRWGYLPTLEASIPEGTHAAPILELAMPDFGRLDVIVAVARTEPAQSLALELWRFDQNNTSDKLGLAAEPSPILRLDAAEKRRPNLDDLRKRMATPRSRVYRPIGHAVDGPKALIARLTTAAKVVRDQAAEPAARAQALATVVRGLDDRLAFERDATARVLDSLASEGWVLTDVEHISERRRRAVVTGSNPKRLEFARKSGGWALVDVEAVATDDTQTQP